MKTNEELNALREEIRNVGSKIRELSEEELDTVSGGVHGVSFEFMICLFVIKHIPESTMAAIKPDEENHGIMRDFG